MRSINRLVVLSHRRALTAVAAIIGAVWMAGCGSPRPLRIHYLPGIVAGSQHIFHRAHIGVYPAQGTMAHGQFRVGTVYGPDGSVKERLFVNDFGALVTKALMRALSDAGLDPVIVKSPSPSRLPDGVDYLLVTTVERVAVVKRFGTKVTVHGRYFTMHSEVQLGIVLSSRAAPALFKGVVVGNEDEPPAPVHHEIFLPLETRPDESLSVAMSRAVGGLITKSGFQQSLPLVQLAPASPVPTPSPDATPEPGPAHL